MKMKSLSRSERANDRGGGGGERGTCTCGAGAKLMFVLCSRDRIQSAIDVCVMFYVLLRPRDARMESLKPLFGAFDSFYWPNHY
jgi:hypothetical protein